MPNGGRNSRAIGLWMDLRFDCCGDSERSKSKPDERPISVSILKSPMPLKKILMRGPNWVGDSVLAIPAMKAVRARFPEAEITLLVRPWVAVSFKRRRSSIISGANPVPQAWAIGCALRGSIRKKSLRSGALVSELLRIGRDDFSRARAAAHRLCNGRTALAADEFPEAQLGKAASGALLPRSRRSRFRERGSAVHRDRGHDEEEKRRPQAAGIEGIAPDRRFLVLNPGAAYGSAKRWGEEGFAEAGDTLPKNSDLDVVIVGSEVERSIAESIQRRMRSRVAVLNGKTSLETLIGVISGSSLVLTNDSGPMHIAAALGVPTVAVFGATDDVVTGPWGPHARVVREPSNAARACCGNARSITAA